VVTKFVPGSKTFGGLTRTARFVGALRERFDVEVLGYVEDGQPSLRSKPSTLVTSLATRRAYQVVRYDTPWLRRRVAEQIRDWRPDAVFADYLQLAPMVWDFPGPKALDLHNVESALAAGIAESSKGLTSRVAARDARLLRGVEQRASERFQLVTAPSAKEAARMPGTVHVVPNGVDPSRQPLDVEPDPDLVCFVGVMSWVPNVDGAEWLVHRVLPLLPPRMRVQIVGRNPDRRVQSLAGLRVEVTGEVDDTWPYVSNASVILAPLLAPGGTRHKILEGLLASRPVVATPAAADGLDDLAGRGVVLAGDPQSFADAVVALSEDRQRAATLGAEGRRAVIADYSWDASLSRLLSLYDSELGLR
jgi:glycosyltransferase involved in cell wall biosynthesis